MRMAAHVIQFCIFLYLIESLTGNLDVLQLEDRFNIRLLDKNQLSSVNVPSLLQKYDFRDPASVDAFRQSLPELRTPDYITIFSTEQQFACKLPTERIRTEEERKKQLSVHEIVHKVETGFALFNCVRKRFELWTYELCHGNKIRRFLSQGKAKKVKEEILAEGAPVSLSLPPRGAAGTPHLPYYFEEVYQGKCKRNKDRMFADDTSFITVRYECDRKVTRVGSYIVDVEEKSPCDIALTVKMGILCDVAAFRPDKQHLEAMEIVCQPVFDNNEFDAFVKQLRTTQELRRKYKGKLAHACNIRYEILRSLQRRRAAKWLTQKVRDEDKYLKSERRLKALWLRHLKRYIEAVAIAERGSSPSKADLQTLVSIGTILDDRDDYFRAFGGYWEDQNRGLLWQYFHDPWWPKSDWPVDLNEVDLYNGYDSEILEEIVREIDSDDPENIFRLRERLQTRPGPFADNMDFLTLIMTRGWLKKARPHIKELMSLIANSFPAWYPFSRMFDEHTGKPKEIDNGDVAEMTMSEFFYHHGSEICDSFRKYLEDRFEKEPPLKESEDVQSFVGRKLAAMNTWISFYQNEFLEEDDKYLTLEYIICQLALDMQTTYLSVELQWEIKNGLIQLGEDGKPLRKDPRYKRIKREIREIEEFKETLYFATGEYQATMGIPMAELGMKVMQYLWREEKARYVDLGHRVRTTYFDTIEVDDVVSDRWALFEEILRDPQMTGNALIIRTIKLLHEFPRSSEKELTTLLTKIISSVNQDELMDLFEEIEKSFPSMTKIVHDGDIVEFEDEQEQEEHDSEGENENE